MILLWFASCLKSLLKDIFDYYFFNPWKNEWEKNFTNQQVLKMGTAALMQYKNNTFLV